jgi:sec-independent protein translocase protein TatA
MFGSLGLGEILVIALIVVVLFGGTRIAGLGQGLGDGIRHFKRALRGDDESDRAQ